MRAQQDDPTLAHIVYRHQLKAGDVAQPDQIVSLTAPLHDAVEMWRTVSGFLLMIGIFTWVFLAGERMSSFTNWLGGANKARHPLQPLSKPERRIAFCVALAMLVSGVIVLVKVIQANVWEREPMGSYFLTIYPSVFFAFMIFGVLLRDYRLVHYGPASRALTAEQIESIRQAMEDYDMVTAINLYREAVPDASLGEAQEYAERLAESLREQHPGKYVPPALSLANMNWDEMFKMTVIWAVVGGIAWPIAGWSLWALPRFVSATVFTMGLMAGARVKARLATAAAADSGHRTDHCHGSDQAPPRHRRDTFAGGLLFWVCFRLFPDDVRLHASAQKGDQVNGPKWPRRSTLPRAKSWVTEYRNPGHRR